MERKYKLSFVILSVLVTFVFTCLIGCAVLFIYNTSELFSGRNSSAEAGVSYNLDELMQMISDKYIGTFDDEELMVMAKRAAVAGLGDQWSYYMTPEEFSMYMTSSENTYHGIGVEVLIDESAGGIEITNVYSNSNAQAAGIRIGDILTAIDGQSVAGYTIFDVRAALRRELNETALLTLIRTDGNIEDVTVVYGIIYTSPVAYDMLEGSDGRKIGYVALSNFEGSSADEFISAVETLISQGAGSFIYDVRSNNGGRVSEMTRILDLLLPEGEIFISVDETGTEHVTYSDKEFIDLPAVVLVNQYSYSGAEYFAACLSEHGYALTVGEQTTGKNRMQSTLRLSDGGALHISTGMFLTPNRVDLFNEGGYVPDYVIELTEDELYLFYSGGLTYDTDPQLQKAMELLAVKN